MYRHSERIYCYFMRCNCNCSENKYQFIILKRIYILNRLYILPVLNWKCFWSNFLRFFFWYILFLWNIVLWHTISQGNNTVNNASFKLTVGFVRCYIYEKGKPFLIIGKICNYMMVLDKTSVTLPWILILFFNLVSVIAWI